jgi:magnesium-transporting ATPase (P-type)
MPENKLSSEKNEELRVQVMLAIYQTDIQTQTAIIFGASAFLIGVGAIFFSNPSMMPYWQFLLIISFTCFIIIVISVSRYIERRKQLDNLRKKYCPDAYK